MRLHSKESLSLKGATPTKGNGLYWTKQLPLKGTISLEEWFPLNDMASTKRNGF